MERNVADSLTYHIDLGHRVDQNYREDCNCQTKEEGAGKIPDYTSENRAQVGFIALIKDIFFPSQFCSQTFQNLERLVNVVKISNAICIFA